MTIAPQADEHLEIKSRSLVRGNNLIYNMNFQHKRYSSKWSAKGTNVVSVTEQNVRH